MEFLSNPVSISVISTISLLLLCIYVYNQHNQRKKTKTKKHHPIAGTMFNQLLNFNRLHDYMTDLAKKHKTYRLISPFRYEVYTSDPVNVEYILKTNFENYVKGTYTHDILKDLLGDGIFTVDGDRWREQRKVSSYEFSTKVLRDFSSVIFRKNAVKLAHILSEAASNNQILDINDFFMKATLDSIFKVAFGIDLDSMCGSSEEGVRFSNAFDESSAMTLKRYVDITWKIKKFFNIGSEAKLKESVKVVDEFVYKLIKTKTEQMHKNQDDFSWKREDILSRFLQINDTDPKYLRDIILNFIIAGKDTTSTAMTWFIYMLCKHPEIQDKVAKEIKEAINFKNDVTNVEVFSNVVTEEALEKMHYLHAALTETLRLFPAVPVDAKICASDDVLPDGYNVNKGDMVAYQPYAMGRMKFLWGEDAQQFKPERWIDENGCFRPESPFKFTAFQAGQRICLGREFAYRQMKIFASILLGCFVFKLSDENKTSKYKTMLNLHIDGGLHVRVFSRYV
ncbi:cytochrome P450 704C1 [Lactuca sativa]|nr:cytochrome P450 704C1 [Lactuca sativa]